MYSCPDVAICLPTRRPAGYVPGDICSSRNHPVGGNRGVGQGVFLNSTRLGVINPAGVIGQLARSDFETPPDTVAYRQGEALPEQQRFRY